MSEEKILRFKNIILCKLEITFEENLINPPDIIGEINVNNLMGISTIFLDNIGKDDITFILTSKNNRETDNKKKKKKKKNIY
ncbi:MAG: hypothetical protein R6U96_01325 [Promethearchaeia archaeon]